MKNLFLSFDKGICKSQGKNNKNHIKSIFKKHQYIHKQLILNKLELKKTVFKNFLHQKK